MNNIDFTFSKINIGSSDGASEANEENFLDMFYTENDFYNTIMKPRKFIVSGRKGTGKTLLGKYIEKIHHNPKELSLVKYIILPKNITDHTLIEANNRPISDTEMITFPEFYILKKLAEIITDNAIPFRFFRKKYKGMTVIKFWRKYRASYRILKRFLNRRYPSDDFIIDTRETMDATSVGTEVSKSPSKFTSCFTSQNKNNYTKTNFSLLLKKVRRNVYNCAKFIKFIAIFDDLDEIKIYKDLRHSKEFLSNFISFVYKLNADLRKNSFDNNDPSKCIILIRDDILRSLDSMEANLNKKTVDGEVKLYWLSKEKNHLIDMICNKIKNCNADFKNLSNTSIQEQLFGVLKDKKREDCLSKIISQSFGRPRDLIVRFNMIFESYPKESKINLTMVNSNLEYSLYLWSEVKNELTYGHDEAFINGIEELLKNFAHKTFSYQDWELYYNENINHDIKKQYSAFDVITILYETGALGNLTFTDENSSNYRVSFFYRPNGSKKPDINKRFTIHYGIRKALNV